MQKTTIIVAIMAFLATVATAKALTMAEIMPQAQQPLILTIYKPILAVKPDGRIDMNYLPDCPDTVKNGGAPKEDKIIYLFRPPSSGPTSYGDLYCKK